ncbi:peptidyl-prolyl cis-trans isomerase cyclophilin type [Paenibacillus curdlanolyticus YK9]|uniref:Peptidyl-prolyl cis-trans isomerase n=1 Tax=Paenibacillus curdlanolyticus YK9 TaxID=717606 RepID=E0IA08_9BACL|nr:peptidyl-prolyl cis-trans isomerase cyclophilin type [Paenibacillus curdlanolyticus YK9]
MRTLTDEMREIVVKHRLQGLVIGMLVGVLLCAATAYAATGTITVEFKKLTFLFDGVEKKPTGDGAFMYKGTTYVPLRFVSESIGKPITYDAKNSIIRVGKGYTKMPAMTINTSKKYKAKVTTTLGAFTIELFAKEAPLTVNNFVALSQDGYYDNVIFHRVLEDFVIQSGDPTGTGAGGPGYTFKDELNNGYTYKDGIVAMANAGPNTNGSQFFICTGANSEQLNNYPNYSIFGKITEGLDIVHAISKVKVQASETGEISKPVTPVKIKSIVIEVS